MSSKAILGFINGGKQIIRGAGNVANEYLPTNITQPIVASANAVPDTESLWVSMPLITIMGIVVVIFIIFATFRTQINNLIQAVFNYMNAFVQGVEQDISPEQDTDDAPPSPVAPVPTPSIIPLPGMGGMKQVFNISENKYTFDDAEPLCKAMGAELASYDDVVQAWKAGADWCNYGWVKGQSAVYPTQSSTYEKMQKMGTDEQRLACGTVGINGGHFDDTKLQFGVNCYGIKPAETSYNSSINMLPIEPETNGQREFNTKVAKYQSHISNIKLMPFRDGAWSE